MKSSTKSIALFFAVIVAGAMALKADDAPAGNTIYNPNPNHLWNRLNETLFVRTAQDGKKYGLDELDILYWAKTTNLLAGASHQQALKVLDEFIHSHGEQLIRDPLKRALLQRDLWALFDWLAVPRPSAPYPAQRRELQSRLVTVIRRVALTTNEIASLPDNYADTGRNISPDLPQGLFETNGDWVNLAPELYGNDEIAPRHDHSFGGGSAFLVMLHLPPGRPAAISYLNQLSTFAQLNHFWVYRPIVNSWDGTNKTNDVLELNPALPQFPTNTEWALVRRMLVIDADGKIQPTPVTESIQLRRYLGFSRPIMMMVTNYDGYPTEIYIPPQKFSDFQMDRRQNAELHEFAPDEKDFSFVHFFSQGSDQLEWKPDDPAVPDSSTFKRVILDDCRTCHTGTGIYSVLSYSGRSELRDIGPHQLFPFDASYEMEAAMNWKREQFSWGLLQGLWYQAN